MRDVWAAQAPVIESYSDICSKFNWSIPETFNFGGDVVDRWARHRDGPALIWSNEAGEERVYSFSDMSRMTSQFANVLREQGVKKGDRVLVMLPRIPEWMVAVVGVMKTGAIPIPCVEMLTSRDIEYRVDNAGVAAVVCRAEHAAKFASVESRVDVKISVGRTDGWLEYAQEMNAASDAFEPETVFAEDPAMMYYTSGSTGHPKGVVHSARAIYAWRTPAIYWLDLCPGERMWCTSDTGWGKAANSILIGPWSCGACSVFYDGPFVPEVRLRLLEKHRVTVFCASNTEFSRLVGEDIGQFDLSNLRRTVTSGEALNPAVANRWQQATGLRVDEAYGQTEVLMLTLNFPGVEVRYGSMGLPAPGLDVDVVRPDGSRASDGEEGEVAVDVSNPQMMLGYWKDQERTRAATLNVGDRSWYLTGDLAVRDKDGYLWYRGRNDDVINSAGYRIGPLEVENALSEHPSVQLCAVIGAPDVERGEVVKAFVILQKGAVGSPELTKALQDHVKVLTAPYKYPRAIEYVSELPMTITGKIRRRDLRVQEMERYKLRAATGCMPG